MTGKNVSTQSAFRGVIEYNANRQKNLYCLKNTEVFFLSNGIVVYNKMTSRLLILVDDIEAPVLLAIETITVEGEKVSGFISLDSHIREDEENYSRVLLQRDFVSSELYFYKGDSLYAVVGLFPNYNFVEYENVLFSHLLPRKGCIQSKEEICKLEIPIDLKTLGIMVSHFLYYSF